MSRYLSFFVAFVLLLGTDFITLAHNGEEFFNTPEAKSIREKYQGRLNTLHDEIKVTRLDVSKELSSPHPNKAKVKKGVKKISDLRCEQQLLLTDQLFELRETIPEEKRAEFMQPIVERYSREMPRPGQMPRPGRQHAPGIMNNRAKTK